VIVVITYTGVLRFLEDDNQYTFINISGNEPTSLLLETAKKGVPMKNTCILTEKLHDFVFLCELFIFCSIVTHRYVNI